MDICLTGSWTIGRMYFIFSVQEFISYNFGPVNMNNLDPRMSGKKQNGDFLEMACYDFN
jgi:hypothetical protein